MYNDALANNYIIGNIRSAGYKSCVVETEHFTPSEINAIAYELNLELNFVNNTDMQRGNYHRAAESFTNVLNLKHDHALAMYYLGICELKLGNNKKGNDLLNESKKIVTKDPVWDKYAKKFDLFNKINETGMKTIKKNIYSNHQLAAN